MQEFYNLSQACDYLNENYPSVNFNTQKLLHKIAELDTPAYFYFSGCHTLAWYNTNFIDDSLTETEKHQIENAIERIFSALLDPITYHAGLFFQLYKINLQQILLKGFTELDGQGMYDFLEYKVNGDCFCGVAIPPDLNKNNNINTFIKDILKKDGLDVDFFLSDFEIHPSFTHHKHLDDDITQKIANIKSLPNVINIESVESLKNPIGRNSIYDLVPAFRLTIDDLTILHNDLIYIGNHITANQQQIVSLKDQLEQKEREINALQAQIDQQVTATPANYALSAENSSYTTPFIDVLNAVIQEFWINYQEHNIPPKQNTVISWIMEHYNLSRAGAKAIEQVARPAKAKTGGVKRLS